MLLPRLFGEDLLDDLIEFPDPREFAKIDRKLYGKRAAQVMRTDVKEHEDGYEVDIDLTGLYGGDSSYVITSVPVAFDDLSNYQILVGIENPDTGETAVYIATNAARSGRKTILK